MNRRTFISTSALTLGCMAIGCKVPETIPVECGGVGFPPCENPDTVTTFSIVKEIRAGAIFSLEEIEADTRFITEYDLGISLNQTKLFKFREHTTHNAGWKPGVIVDDGKHWVPYYAALSFDTMQILLLNCPEAIDAEVNTLQHHIEYMRTLGLKHTYHEHYPYLIKNNNNV